MIHSMGLSRYHFRPGRGLLISLGLGLSLLLSSCSLKFFYNQLDALIPQYVEDLVSLDDALAEQLDQRTRVLLHWHRSTQLPEYAAWMQQAQRDVLAGPSAQQVLDHLTRLDGFWQSLSRAVNEQMAVLLPRLDTGQREQLFASLAEKNQEFREEHIDIGEQERIEQYTERLQDSFERWLDDLSEPQQRLIERTASQLVSTAELRLQRRQAWQQGIREILDSSSHEGDKSRRLLKFLQGFEQFDNAAMQQATDHNRRLLAQLTAQVATSMNVPQRTHFVDTSNDYIDIFRELAADAETNQKCCA